VTNTSSIQRQPLHIFESGPDRLFRVERVGADGEIVSGEMSTGPWLAGPTGTWLGGSMGVLIDNVLGYAVIMDRPVDHWSVSTEITIDLCRSVPTDGGALLAQARIQHSDSRGGISSGTVVDDQGRLIAMCRQHGRFVGRTPTGVTPSDDHPADVPPHGRPESLFALLGAEVRMAEAGAAVVLTAGPELVNPMGNLHGGIALCASELAAQAALGHEGQLPQTASIHVAYVRPVPLGTPVMFSARPMYAGRTFGVVQVTATDGEGRVCTIATVTARS
jgi:uncharacterized protein (TIGR00369 family)